MPNPTIYFSGCVVAASFSNYLLETCTSFFCSFAHFKFFCFSFPRVCCLSPCLRKLFQTELTNRSDIKPHSLLGSKRLRVDGLDWQDHVDIEHNPTIQIELDSARRLHDISSVLRSKWLDGNRKNSDKLKTVVDKFSHLLRTHTRTASMAERWWC